MHIPVSQISEDGWTAALEIPLASLKRVVETHGPQNGMLRAQVTLKNHKGCVDVRGHVVAELSLVCGVCLDAGIVRVEAPLELMVAPQALWQSGHREGQHEEVRISAADLDVSFYDGDEIDLTAVLEDELLVAAPESLSEQDEAGNCTTCHRRVEAVLAERQATHPEDAEFHPFRDLAERIYREYPASEAGSSAKRVDRTGRALARDPSPAQPRGADNTVGRERHREKRTHAARDKTGS
ncbi:MAG: YceD family protein [SAR324 cluster bacterium]